MVQHRLRSQWQQTSWLAYWSAKAGGYKVGLSQMDLMDRAQKRSRPAESDGLDLTLCFGFVPA